MYEVEVIYWKSCMTFLAYTWLRALYTLQSERSLKDKWASGTLLKGDVDPYVIERSQK